MYNTIGVIGLGVMGSNIALNMASKGEKVAVYNYTRDLTDQLVAKIGQSIDPSVLRNSRFCSVLRNSKKDLSDGDCGYSDRLSDQFITSSS